MAVQGKKHLFLVNTGSLYKIVLEDLVTTPLSTCGLPALRAVNGSTVAIKGKATVQLVYQGHTYTHSVLVGNVMVNNILGYDFIVQHNILLSFPPHGPVLIRVSTNEIIDKNPVFPAN